jgi:hypothetical protein
MAAIRWLLPVSKRALCREAAFRTEPKPSLPPHNHGRKALSELGGEDGPHGMDQLWRSDITYIRLHKEIVFLRDSSGLSQ